MLKEKSIILIPGGAGTNFLPIMLLDLDKQYWAESRGEYRIFDSYNSSPELMKTKLKFGHQMHFEFDRPFINVYFDRDEDKKLIHYAQALSSYKRYLNLVSEVDDLVELSQRFYEYQEDIGPWEHSIYDQSFRIDDNMWGFDQRFMDESLLNVRWRDIMFKNPKQIETLQMLCDTIGVPLTQEKIDKIDAYAIANEKLLEPYGITWRD